MWVNFHIPTGVEFERGLAAYGRNVTREDAYERATAEIAESWGQPFRTAEAIASLIDEWNHYYLRFSLRSLADCISTHQAIIEGYRDRDITSLRDDDDPQIILLHMEVMTSMRRRKDGSKGSASTSQGLHLLCPRFFPMWNRGIAKVFRARYSSPGDDREPYCKFCHRMAATAGRIKGSMPPDDPKTAVKRIHEFAWAVSHGWTSGRKGII